MDLTKNKIKHGAIDFVDGRIKSIHYYDDNNEIMPFAEFKMSSTFYSFFKTARLGGVAVETSGETFIFNEKLTSQTEVTETMG